MAERCVQDPAKYPLRSYLQKSLTASVVDPVEKSLGSNRLFIISTTAIISIIFIIIISIAIIITIIVKMFCLTLKTKKWIILQTI